MRRACAALLGVALLASLPACGLGGGDTYHLTAYFDRAVSVFPSSDVRVLGLPAGEVSEVEVDGDRVRIEMSIPSDIKIPEDATAQIVPQSLIGERYIQIYPAFKNGMTPARDGGELTHTVIPVEPDEALAALKEFLDSLDPEGLGKLVTNLEGDLRGNGASLNDALGGLSTLVATFAEKDDALLRIVDSFDRLSATLVTRERQLGEVLDAFAEASQVLADEREGIEDLVGALADLSRNGLALVAEHSQDLRADIETLAKAAASINANLDEVTLLLAAGPQLSEGIIGAYNEDLRALDLRNNFSPLTTELIGLLGPEICLPILQVCPTSAALSAGTPTPASLRPAHTPVSALLGLLDAPTAEPSTAGRGVAERLGSSIRDAVTTLLGVAG